MYDLKNLIGGVTDNNSIYIIFCVALAYVGIKITRKIVKFIMGIIFLGYTLLKLAISYNLTSLIK